MADAGGGDDAFADEVVFHGGDAEAGLEFEAEEGEDAGELVPGGGEVVGLEGVPDGDEFAGEVAAGHLAAGSALIFFDEELAVEAAEEDEIVSGGGVQGGGFGGGGGSFDFDEFDVGDFASHAGEEGDGEGDLREEGGVLDHDGDGDGAGDFAEIVEEAIAVGFEVVGGEDHEGVGAEVFHFFGEGDGGVGAGVTGGGDEGDVTAGFATDELHQGDALFGGESIAFASVAEEAETVGALCEEVVDEAGLAGKIDLARVIEGGTEDGENAGELLLHSEILYHRRGVVCSALDDGFFRTLTISQGLVSPEDLLGAVQMPKLAGKPGLLGMLRVTVLGMEEAALPSVVSW